MKLVASEHLCHKKNINENFSHFDNMTCVSDICDTVILKLLQKADMRLSLRILIFS